LTQNVSIKSFSVVMKVWFNSHFQICMMLPHKISRWKNCCHVECKRYRVLSCISFTLQWRTMAAYNLLLVSADWCPVDSNHGSSSSLLAFLCDEEGDDGLTVCEQWLSSVSLWLLRSLSCPLFSNLLLRFPVQCHTDVLVHFLLSTTSTPLKPSCVWDFE